MPARSPGPGRDCKGICKSFSKGESSCKLKLNKEIGTQSFVKILSAVL